MQSLISNHYLNFINKPIFRHISDFLSAKCDFLFAAFLLIYIIAISFISLLKLHTFYTTHDLGIFTQSLWTTIFDGKFFFNSLEFYNNNGVISHFGIHTSPILFLLIPVYLIHPGPEILLITQSALYGLGAVPLYLAAKKILDNHAALVVSIIYFLYPALHGANIYDFYEISFLPLFLGFFLYGCIFKKDLLILLCGIACITIKEDIPIIIICISLWEILQNRRGTGKSIYIYAFLLILSIIWLILSFAIFMPSFYPVLDKSSSNAFIPQYFSSMSNFSEKLYPRGEYLFQVFLPLLFLPLFSPELLILAIPSFAEILLSASYFDITYHFTPLVIPILFFASIFSLKKLKLKYSEEGKGWYNLILIILILNAIFCFFLFSPVMNAIDLVRVPEESHADSDWFKDGIALIPSDKTISTQSNLYSLLADRPEIIEGYSHEPDYIVLKLDTPQCQIFIKDFPAIVKLYSCIYQKGLFYILKRNNESQENANITRINLNYSGEN